MHRAIIIISLFFIAAITPAVSSAGGPELKGLTTGVYAYIGGAGSTNSGFIVTGKGVIIIDSQGPRERALDLKARIKKVTNLPIIYVINTHYHGDHTFGNQYFKGTIISHKTAREDLIQKDKAHRARFKKIFGPKSLDGFRLTLPEITFTDELRLYEGATTIIIRHVGPAHTGGDAYVYLPKERIAFTGDILYKGRMPWLGEGSVAGTIKALGQLLALDAHIYVPGHGGLASKKDVMEFKKYLTDLTKEVRRLKAEGKDAEQIGEEIKLPRYSAYLKYNEWLPLNAKAVYKEIEKAGKAAPE